MFIIEISYSKMTFTLFRPLINQLMLIRDKTRLGKTLLNLFNKLKTSLERKRD